MDGPLEYYGIPNTYVFSCKLCDRHWVIALDSYWEEQLEEFSQMMWQALHGL